ncbi:MAG: hypothetical protein IJ300_02195 [Clostridia bacterium]|nr:hypothetical protein [Clostridia bacterium]
MLKIGVIGEYEKICSFSCLGFDTVPVKSEEEAKDALLNMLKKDYPIIYISTEYFVEVNSTSTAVIPLPEYGTALGADRLNKLAEKAVGSKI